MTPPPAEPCTPPDGTEPSQHQANSRGHTGSFCRGYLARLKLPVVDDARWDDGRVVPVTRAAVVLAHVVTLSGLTGHTPCQINLSVSGLAHTSGCGRRGLFMVCVLYVLTQ